MVDVCRRFGRPALRALVVAGVTAGAGAAIAQGLDCNRLFAAIQSADGAASAPSRWERAAERQRREIARTQRYADQLRCGQGGLFGSGLFGNDSPQCGAVQDRLRRMQENLSALEAQPDDRASDDGNRRAALVARYNAQCVGMAGGSPVDAAPSDSRDLIPDGRNPADLADPDDLSRVPLNGDIMDESGEPRHALGQAICVRTCDGGYFPLSPRATEDQLDSLDQLCRASCPATEAKLYTMGRDGELANATAVDGTSYMALPAAFKFEKIFTPTCTCKPAGTSWVDALAEAETLLGSTDRHDIKVTASLSDQMAKPGAAPLPGKSAKAARLPPPAPAVPDLSMAREAQKALQAPTASNDTSGIGGPDAFRRTLREGDGQTIGVAGPDGVKKTIRLIVP